MHRRESLKLGLMSGTAMLMTGCAPKPGTHAVVPAHDMKTLGLIGGTSWHSTIDYYRYINQMVEERKGTNPPLLMYSLDLNLMRRNNWDEINETFLEIAQALEAAGAQAIVICANTPHKTCPYLEPKLGIPVLHIADAIAAQAKKLGLKKLGLLGTQQVMAESFISGRLAEKHEINVQVPEIAMHEKIHGLIAEELTRGIFLPETRSFFLEQMHQLKARGTDGIIMGCTELPLLIRQEDFELPLLDSTWLHAGMAADFILS
jgi:aspartate racemase